MSLMKSCVGLLFSRRVTIRRSLPSPPATSPGDNSVIPVKVNVSTSLMNVLAISEFSHTIDLKLGITLKWYESRVVFHNLKTKEALNTLTDEEALTLNLLQSSSFPIASGPHALDPLHHLQEHGQ